MVAPACGRFPRQLRLICLEQDWCGQGAALCIMTANLPVIMSNAGPDAYRLAHLEAGLVAQRLYLTTGAMGLAACAIGAFYDDDIRKFLGLSQTGWEPILCMVIGRV